MDLTIHVRIKTGKNKQQGWTDIRPLKFQVRGKQQAFDIAYQFLAYAQRNRPDDEHIEVRWNWVESQQGFYI